tara:strand:- start:1083 stop:1823 length:741 start_codon:yes stop_codon:yes gene_type:complete
MNRRDEIKYRKHFDKECDNYYRKYHMKNIAGHSFRSRMKLAFSMLDKHKLGNLLDAGGGPGLYYSFFKNKLDTYHLIDISSEMIAKASIDNNGEKNFKCKTASVYEIPYKNNTFDTVLVMGVMEYLEFPRQGLLDIKRVTKKDGIILVSYPNKNSPMRKMTSIIYKIFNKSNPFASKMFTKEEVKLMAEDLELSIIETKGYNAQLIPFPLTWKIGRLSYFLAVIFEPLLNVFGSMWGTAFIIKLKK